jgi:uncharacterized membrane protein YeiH
MAFLLVTGAFGGIASGLLLHPKVSVSKTGLYRSQSVLGGKINYELRLS